MAEYEVAPKGAVYFKGKVYTEQMKVPNLPFPKLQEHIESGFMVECNSIATLVHPGTLAPGTTRMLPIGEDGLEGKEKPIEVHTLKEETSKPSVKVHQTTPDDDDDPVDPPAKQGSLWALDPDGLRGKPLAELNIMVAERKPDERAFEDAAEAVAWLSQDYKEPTPAA